MIENSFILSKNNTHKVTKELRTSLREYRNTYVSNMGQSIQEWAK